MQDALAGHQLALLAGFSNLSQQHRQHVEEAAAAWQQLTAGAAALEQRQVRYESLQVCQAVVLVKGRGDGYRGLQHELPVAADN